MDPSARSEIDLAYHLPSLAWGKGYATEAVIAVLAQGLGPVGLNRVMAVTMPENVGSWRVMENAGMRYGGSAAYYGLEGLREIRRRARVVATAARPLRGSPKR